MTVHTEQNVVSIVLPTLEETQRFGRKLGGLALAGDVVALEGDLGAGKTTLTQAIGHGLEVPKSCYITSPTFSLLHEYPGRIPLYHMDLYRLADPEELEYLGFEEYFYGEGLTVIEWPDRLGDFMPDERLEVHLEFTGPDSRKATLTAFGESWIERLTCLI